ncbi:protein SPMIP2-like isoform X1 [Montipora foliosa]|uniref:protein SPMIP2-like isoform X1 n=1 Tax=Montipora foliosa TaxID=591990 RepID=UPI0035F13182
MSEKASVLSWKGSDKYYNPYIGRGDVLFTGPDGIRDHQATVLNPNTYVGIGTMSPEGTSDLNYLWRPSRGCPHPVPKSAKVGGIGWGLQFYSDYQLLRSGHQIKLGEFRQATEDRHTHLYQNPWYPGPNDKQEEDENKDEQVPQCSRTERHTRCRRQFRSHTPTPQRTTEFRQITSRPQSAVFGSKPRSGTQSSSTSLHSQHTDHNL